MMMCLQRWSGVAGWDIHAQNLQVLRYGHHTPPFETITTHLLGRTKRRPTLTDRLRKATCIERVDPLCNNLTITCN